MFRPPVFEEFVAPATRYPAIWRIFLGIITALICYVILAFAIVFVVNALLGFYDPLGVFNALAQPDTPVAMALLLTTFIGMALAAMIAALWHFRNPLTLFGPARRVFTDWPKAVVIVAVVMLGSSLISGLFYSPELTQKHDLRIWFGFMIWAVPLLIIQTGAEEMFFRGYLQQQLAARFRHPVIWMVLPSMLFGLAHFNPAYEPLTAALIILATGTFGLVAADFTRITGSLGAAMGFHFANNFFALLLVGVAGELSALSLFHTDFTMEDSHIIQPLLVADTVTIIIIWAIARRFLKR